jgi:hypothetical protein
MLIMARLRNLVEKKGISKHEIDRILEKSATSTNRNGQTSS